MVGSPDSEANIVFQGVRESKLSIPFKSTRLASLMRGEYWWREAEMVQRQTIKNGLAEIISANRKLQTRDNFAKGRLDVLEAPRRTCTADWLG